MNPLLKKVASRYGLIMSAIAVLYLLGAYFINPYYIVWEFVRYPLNIVILVMSMLAFRKLNGGYSSFRETFSAWILPTIYTVVTLLVVKLMLFWVIDPQLNTDMTKYNKQLQIEVAKMAGATPEQLEMQREQLDDRMTNMTKMSLVQQSMFFIVVNAIFGLIISVAFTKNRPGESMRVSIDKRTDILE